MDFSGKHVLVTGGARGLGLEIAKQFLKAGASVTILDKDAYHLNEAKEQNPNFTTVLADLLDWELTQAALEGVGNVDHLVNNAGVNRREMFLDVSEENIDLIFGVNFKGMVNVSQIIAKKMIANKTKGTIVNISSIFGKTAAANVSMYACSKSAIVMLTKCMAVELGEFGIRVNCICPTYMVTPLTKDYIEGNPEKFEEFLERQANKRFLEASEAGDAVMFLSGPGASMITGSSLNVDGGFLAN